MGLLVSERQESLEAVAAYRKKEDVTGVCAPTNVRVFLWLATVYLPEDLKQERGVALKLLTREPGEVVWTPMCPRLPAP